MNPVLNQPRISWNDGGFGTLLIRICKQIALNNMHQNMCWGNSIDLIYDLVICIGCSPGRTHKSLKSEWYIIIQCILPQNAANFHSFYMIACKYVVAIFLPLLLVMLTTRGVKFRNCASYAGNQGHMIYHYEFMDTIPDTLSSITPYSHQPTSIILIQRWLNAIKYSPVQPSFFQHDSRGGFFVASVRLRCGDFTARLV